MILLAMNLILIVPNNFRKCCTTNLDLRDGRVRRWVEDGGQRKVLLQTI